MYIKGYSNHVPTVLEEHIVIHVKEFYILETVLYLIIHLYNTKGIFKAKILPNIYFVEPFKELRNNN